MELFERGGLATKWFLRTAKPFLWEKTVDPSRGPRVRMMLAPLGLAHMGASPLSILPKFLKFFIF